MWQAALIALLKDVAIPELVELIKQKHAATGTWPTKEEMDAMVDAKADKIVDKGKAFLDRPTLPQTEKLAFNDDGR